MCHYNLLLFSEEKNKQRNNVVMARPLGDSHLDLLGTDLQLCHANEYINCYPKGESKQHITD